MPRKPVRCAALLPSPLILSLGSAAEVAARIAREAERLRFGVDERSIDDYDIVRASCETVLSSHSRRAYLAWKRATSFSWFQPLAKEKSLTR